MNRLTMTALAAALLALAFNQAVAEPDGLWKRPNGEIAETYSCNAKLCCKISKGASPGFEMCNGMSKTDDNNWQGSSMKHPEMPGFMTFNGTVTLTGATLTIKGCAIGQSMCDSENWVKVK